MGVSSRIAPIFSFHIFFVNLRLVNIKKIKGLWKQKNCKLSLTLKILTS